jgi:hypothetical protein
MDYCLAPIEVEILAIFLARLQHKAGTWFAKTRKPFATDF